MPRGFFKRSEEAKRKMSLSHIGKIPWNKGKTGIYSEKTKRKMSIARKGLTNGMLGKHHTEKTRRKIGEAVPKGENHHSWKGGVIPINKKIRQSFEYKLWREAIFKRDNYACIWCGDDKGGNLEADHIKPFALFPELRFAIDNGRTLCHKCHLTTDTYGYKILFFIKE